MAAGMLRITGALALAGVLCATAQQPVTTSQYDSARTGARTSETILTPRNVNRNQFGKITEFGVDGAVYAQPLYFPSVPVPGKGTHDLVFVATEHDSVYAFDAAGVIGEPLWHVRLANPDAGVSPVPELDVRCSFLTPEVGITSTPVIDEKTGTIYGWREPKSTKASSAMSSFRSCMRSQSQRERRNLAGRSRSTRLCPAVAPDRNME